MVRIDWRTGEQFFGPDAACLTDTQPVEMSLTTDNDSKIGKKELFAMETQRRGLRVAFEPHANLFLFAFSFACCRGEGHIG